MIELIFRALGFDSISKEEAARELLAREVTFSWRPVIVEEAYTPCDPGGITGT